MQTHGKLGSEEDGKKMKAFECKMCGECCQGQGITLKDEEIKRIARFLDMKEDEFKERYCNRKRGRYELKTADSNYCIFLKKKGKNKVCGIHPVKPELCKRWPFFNAIISDEDEWKMVKDFCPGMNPESSFKDFVEQAKSFMK